MRSTDIAKEVGRFLRTRRERIEHESTGTGFRRTRGLRREEVAERAAVSTEYYTKIEQGRALNPSFAVIQALAVALSLNDDETQYIRDLVALLGDEGANANSSREEVSDDVGRRMISAIRDRPAIVVDYRRYITLWNPMAVELLVDFDDMPAHQRNLTWLMFLDQDFIDLCADWEEMARLNVAMLRAQAGRHPNDESIMELVHNVSARSEVFARYWESNDVLIGKYGTRTINHPTAGRIVMHYDALRLPGEPERHLTVYSASNSDAEEALRLLRTRCTGEFFDQ